MKSEKGITLVSLIVYVIAMLITITIITVVTAYFHQNVDITGEEYDYLTEFTKFESYFSVEANKDKNKIEEINPVNTNEQENAPQNYIILSSEDKATQYTYIKANKAIYQNNVKIASNVENCTFKQETQNGKQVVVVTMMVKDKTRTMRYTLKN